MSESSSSSDSEDSHHTTEENEEALPQETSHVILFVKCILFSAVATLGILYYTNHEELSQLSKELKRIVSKGIVKDTSNAKLESLLQDFQQDAADDGSIIYTINVPPSCHQNGNHASIECSNLLSTQIKEAYLRDGVIAIRGLLSPDEIFSLDQSSLELMGFDKPIKLQEGPLKVGKERGVSAGKQFYTSRHHAIFESQGFQKVALQSLLPRVASELMLAESSMGLDGRKLDSASDSVRLLRDVFLAKDQDPYICGWHVDDVGFWPTTFNSQGINAWIALDTIPKHTGGGFAVAVKSHLADWRFEAYNLTGSTHTLPSEGYRDVEDMIKSRGDGTCNIKNASPLLNEKIEKSKRVYDVQKGDIILHTRWIFHRTVPFEKNFARTLNRKNEKVLYRRYSIRYSPGQAILAQNPYGTEMSMLYNPILGGKTLDDVSHVDGPWYPKCWPNIAANEVEKMNSIKEKMIVSEEKKKTRMKEMKPYLQELGRQQRNKLAEGVKRPGSKNTSSGDPAQIMRRQNSDPQEL